MLSVDNPRWLHRFALLTAAATLALIGFGGLVTSHEAGMAVPDWPNTYGYNMFLFPVSQWIGGILYEHSHRLAAALVGFLTAILAIWAWVRETRGTDRWLGVVAIFMVLLLMGVRQFPVYVSLACQAPVVVIVCIWNSRREPAGLRWWGIICLSLVILQGVLGGLRVVLFKDQIGIIHAALAQIFLVVLCGFALRTSRWWQQAGGMQKPASVQQPSLGRFFVLTTLLMLGQLLLGATMRHQHAGLAVPDFPLAYGKLWPAMDAASVNHYNQQRMELIAVNPITAFQIGLQMAHRMVAVSLVIAVAGCAWLTVKRLGRKHLLSQLALIWLGLLLLQSLLGAATIWSNKAADIATAHVLVGALSLATGAMLSMVFRRVFVPSRETQVLHTNSLAQSPFGRGVATALK